MNTLCATALGRKRWCSRGLEPVAHRRHRARTPGNALARQLTRAYGVLRPSTWRSDTAAIFLKSPSVVRTGRGGSCASAVAAIQRSLSPTGVPARFRSAQKPRKAGRNSRGLRLSSDPIRPPGHLAGPRRS